MSTTSNGSKPAPQRRITAGNEFRLEQNRGFQDWITQPPDPRWTPATRAELVWQTLFEAATVDRTPKAIELLANHVLGRPAFLHQEQVESQITGEELRGLYHQMLQMVRPALLDERGNEMQLPAGAKIEMRLSPAEGKTLDEILPPMTEEELRLAEGLTQ